MLQTLGPKSRFQPIVFSCTIALVQFLLSDAVQANLKTEQELYEISVRVDKLMVELEKERGNEATAITDLHQIEKQMSALSSEIFQQQNLLKVIELDKQASELELEQLALSQQQSMVGLAELARFGYLASNESGLRILLSGDDPSRITRLMAMRKYFVTSRKELIRDIHTKSMEISLTHAELERKSVKIDNLISDLAAHQDALDESEAERQLQLKQIRESMAENELQIALARDRERELKALLKTIQQTESDAKKSEDTSPQKNISTTGPETNQNETKNRDGGFYTNRGNMPMPVSAELLFRFGDVRPESGLRWEGLMLAAQDGQKVSAIHAGQVVFSDWFRGYGQLMVLDHGNGFMSLYGHNKVFEVSLGETVRGGDIITRAGTSGGLQFPGLYFEIRENGIPVDPLKWCRM